MNKTVSIALAGFSFVIEEHAYIKLSDYLQALRNSLEKEEADEVMYDIEIRIAEILKGNMGKREVVSDDDVEKVIAQIGTPEAIGEQEEEYYSENSSYKTNYQAKTQKQLFRDIEGGKIAGVCAGLAHYIGVDVVIIRVIWVALLLFTVFFPTIMIYVILAIVMPKAETASDVLKMKGKPVDFEHIKEESVRFASESGQRLGEFYQENKPTMMRTGDTILKFFRIVLGAIFAFFAFIFAVSGLGVLGAFNLSRMNEIDFVFEEETKYIVIAMAFLTTLIFTIVFAALSIKAFSPKTKIRKFGYVVAVLSLILIGAGAFVGMKASDLSVFYTGKNYEEENIEVKAIDNRIELNTKQVNIPQDFKAYGDYIFSDKNRVFKKDKAKIEIIRKVGVDQPYLVIKKEAEGYNIPMRLTVPVEVREGQILIPNYIGYSYEHRLRDYDVDYELVVPINMQVVDNSKGALRVEDSFNEDYDDNSDEDYDDILEDLPAKIKKGGNIKIETPTDTITIRHQ